MEFLEPVFSKRCWITLIAAEYLSFAFSGRAGWLVDWLGGWQQKEVVLDDTASELTGGHETGRFVELQVGRTATGHQRAARRSRSSNDFLCGNLRT